MIRLYIVRHGIAVDRMDPKVKSDEERWLTEGGKERTRQVAMALAALGVKVDLMLTSPLVRARETAEILGEELGCKLRKTTALEPGFSMTELCQEIMDAGTPENVMIVGHEPDLSELISTLVWGDDRGEVAMKKAGVALLTLTSMPPDEGGVMLEWLLPPKVLVRVK